jgi:hypothetical protein
MTEEIMAGGTSDPRAMAGFELDMSGLSIPGIETGTDYVDLVASQFPPLGQIAENWRTYSSGIEAIRRDGHMTEDERLDRADELHNAAETRYVELVAAMQAERTERLGEIDEALFGAPGGALSYNQVGTAAAQEGFRTSLLSLSGADEQKLQDTVEIAGFTGDRELLRAARALAHIRGHDDVVESSVLKHGNAHERARYVERLAVPTEGNLAVITGSYAPARANLTLLTPDYATTQAAEQEDRARALRRERNRR